MEGEHSTKTNDHNKENPVVLGNQLTEDKNAIPDSQLVDTSSGGIVPTDFVVDQYDVADLPVIQTNQDIIQQIENNQGRTHTVEKDPKSLDPSTSQIT